MAATALLTHKWITTIKNDTGTAVVPGIEIDIVGDCEFNEKVKLVYGETAEIDCGSLDYGKMQSLFMICDANVVISTNAANHSGGQEITLAKNAAYAWNVNQAAANPIAFNITKIYVAWTDVGATVAEQNKGATFRCGFLMSLLV